MSKTRLVLASVLALSAAACGQMNQGKQAPPAQGADQAAPAAEGTDGKPADSAATPAGDAANKPAATNTAPADKPS